MTPNPHRGSDFNDFLAEEGLMTPTPRTDAAIKASKGQWGYLLRDLAQEMERDLAVERAIADRLAGELQWWGDYCGDNAPASIDLALAAWKEARRE
jgi:hypothetical protein